MQDEVGLGLVLDDEIAAIDAPPGDGGVANLLDNDTDALGSLLDRAQQRGPRHALSEVALLAPVPRPGKVFAIGLNYADHVAEARLETPEFLVVFTKLPTCGSRRPSSRASSSPSASTTPTTSPSPANRCPST